MLLFKDLARLSFDLAVVVIFGVLAFLVFSNSEGLVGVNPLDFLILIPLKMSAAIVHWFLFRKIMQHRFGHVNWNESIKDIRANTIFSIVSFVMFVMAYTISYS